MGPASNGAFTEVAGLRSWNTCMGDRLGYRYNGIEWVIFWGSIKAIDIGEWSI